jgi:hypothetical protein
MNIWQIQQDLLDIFNELEENGGELTPELEEKLAVTQEDFKNKVKSYGEVIKSLKGEIDIIDKETARLKELKDAKNKVIERLSKVIAQAITKFGDETKSGGKFLDYGTGKISVRNTEKVEIDTDRTDRIAKNVFNYINNLAYTRELYDVNEISYEDLKKGEGLEDVEYNDLANIPATLTFDVNLKELLQNEGVDFMQTFFRLITNYKVKSNVSKTVMKDVIKEGLFDVSKIAHIEQNQSITIK